MMFKKPTGFAATVLWLLLPTLPALGLPNLRPSFSPAFEYPLVPRFDDDIDGGSYDVSEFLWGGVHETWWSAMVTNDGSTSTPEGFIVNLHVDGDDDNLDFTYTNAPLDVDQIVLFANKGPVTVQGGRHTFEMRIDPGDNIEEEDESDNDWGHQFIWTPLDLAVGSPIQRPAPPPRTGGWSSVPPEETVWYNCDGLSFSSSGWWNALYTAPVDELADVDCRLHEASTGAQAGFAANLGHSSRPAGQLDAVLVNRNTMGNQTWNVGVINANDTDQPYRAEHITSQPFTFGTTEAIDFGTLEFMTLHEIQIEPQNTGWVTVTAVSSPPSRFFDLAWFYHGFTLGDLSEAETATVMDEDGRALLYANASEPGYYCLALHRDPTDNILSCTVTLSIGPGLPDFGPYQPLGWHAPLVPRPAPDGTPALVALPDTLHGGEPSTYYNLTVGNFSPVGYDLSTPRIGARIEWDREFLTQYTFFPLPAYSYHRYNGNLAFAVPGGRHTFIMEIDYADLIAEGDETNNAYGEQYCWSPVVLAQGEPLVREVPPYYYAGVETVAYPEPFFPNCDGLRVQEDGSWWQGVALISQPGDPTTFTNLSLYDMLSGVKDGFDYDLVTSTFTTASANFCLVNYNMTSHADFDVGIQRVLEAAVEGDLVVETMSEIFLGDNPEGSFGPFTLGSERILNLHELALNAGQWAFRLNNVAGSLDWGIGLYPADRSYLGRLDHVEDGSAYLRGPGECEAFTVTLADPGYYCLAVWRQEAESLYNGGDYSLEIQYGVSPVPEGGPLPERTVLRGAHPNPANPRTEITFEMASAGLVTLRVFDVSGRLVRKLLSGEMPCGRHTVVWDGCTDNGRTAASGTYCVRMETGSTCEMKKLSLVR
jgi:hypothetical protein